MGLTFGHFVATVSIIWQQIIESEIEEPEKIGRC